MNTFLFDIDGTLIRSGGAGGNAVRGAFQECFDVAQPADVPFSGRTDRGIINGLFEHHNIAKTPANWGAFRGVYLRRLPGELARCDGRVLEGVMELLDELQSRDDVALGLLTGNMAAGARIKLEYYGMSHYFPFGGFGDDHAHRHDVARAALAAAEDYLGVPAVVERTWVIGDTPLDVSCARAIGARVVAVATGFHDHDELRSADPDLLLDNLAPLLSHVSL